MLHRPALLSLFLGGAAATGFAPLNLWPLSLACLALWMACVARAPTLGRALLIGWAFGVGHFTIGNNWIQHAFTFQDKMPHWLGYLAVVLLALYLAVYPMLAAGLAWRFRRGGLLSFVLVFAGGWIVTEWLRSTMFTGYVWNPLGVAWLMTPVAQSASWIGTYALSGLFVLAAGAATLAFRRNERRGAIGIAAALAVLAVASALLAPATTSDPALRVVVVQPDLGQEERPRADYAEANFAALAALTGPPSGARRLVMWPEGAVRYFLEDGYPAPYYWRAAPAETRARLAMLLGPNDILLTGAQALEIDAKGELSAARNAVYAIAPGGRILGRYDKAHLVPYGEYLPMRPLLSAIGLSRLAPGDLDFLPGPAARTLDLPGFGKAGVQICYEIIFSGQVVDRSNRPDFLFNPSNDSWFGAWGSPQHLAQARMRAIEEGMPVLRSTPTGISAVIDARGRLLGIVGRNMPGIVDLPLPAPAAPTLFARTGNVMAFTAAAILFAFAIALRRRAR